MMNSKLQILVVDDDIVIGRSFDRVLSGKGFDVCTALSGEEALRNVESKNFDVVFTDIKMPGMDGLEVAERIKTKCPWTPVVVVTGYGTEENEARASVLGVNGFVRKPLTPEIIEGITLKAMLETDPVVKPVEDETTVHAEVASDIENLSRVQKAGRFARNVGLFFAAPFIALAYVVALPIVGFYMFAKLGHEAYTKRRRSA
jgi:CheY-like chemotaxis protein